MTLPLFQVDAFTDRPFAGNPAAVCLLEGPADAGWMQAVAAEMNLSETAFLHPKEGEFALRWFTPAVEVDLCGHATLASAHVLWSESVVPESAALRFSTQSGPLGARLHGDGWIELDFPAEPAEPEPIAMEILDALGVEALWTGRNRLDYLVEVENRRVLLDLEPDFRVLGEHTPRGVIVTCAAEEDGLDFLSRFFAPAAGIDEDPVTGSAHACLGPFWSGRLGRGELTGFQASARGGVVKVRSEGERVALLGQAVTVFRAQLSALGSEGPPSKAGALKRQA